MDDRVSYSSDVCRQHFIKSKLEKVYMQGIQFVTDEKGQKIAVQINLKKLGEVWEDFYDNLLFQQRDIEPRESISSVKERLKKLGKLHG